jgi:hypothetical protein
VDYQAAIKVTSDETLANKVDTAGNGLPAGTVDVKVTGSLTGVTNIRYSRDGIATSADYTILAADRTAGAATLSIQAAAIFIDRSSDTTHPSQALWLTVNGTTVQSARSFTVEVTLKKAAPILRDRALVAAGTTAWTWTLDATNIYIPLVGFNTAGTRETFIKIFSKSSAAGSNAVTVSVLASDGTMVALNAGTITPGVAFTLTGSGLGAGVDAAGKTVDGVQGFPAIISINAPEADLFIFANIVDPSGAKVVPSKVVGGVISE